MGYAWGKTDERIEIAIKNEFERQTYYGALDYSNPILVATDIIVRITLQSKYKVMNIIDELDDFINHTCIVKRNKKSLSCKNDFVGKILS